MDDHAAITELLKPMPHVTVHGTDCFVSDTKPRWTARDRALARLLEALQPCTGCAEKAAELEDAQRKLAQAFNELKAVQHPPHPGPLLQRIREAVRTYQLTPWVAVTLTEAANAIVSRDRTIRMLRDLQESTAPCGHPSAYLHTADGGKHITCFQCRAERAEALTRP